MATYMPYRSVELPNYKSTQPKSTTIMTRIVRVEGYTKDNEIREISQPVCRLTPRR